MSFIIDTHIHLSSDYSNEELIAVLDDAKIAGVSMFFDVGYNLESSKRLSENILEHNNIYGIVGIHPDDITKNADKEIDEIKKIASSNKKIIGIGEIGLDYYHMTMPKEVQKKYFIKQLKIAKKLNLPVSIHVRDHKNNYDAYEDCYLILKQLDITKGAMHCFLGTSEIAEKFIKQGLYISFSGIVTFKNAKNIQECAKKIPLDKLLVETDAPYLSPEPYRGNKNYPVYIKYTVKKIANLKRIPEEELIGQLRKNTFKCFDIKK